MARSGEEEKGQARKKSGGSTLDGSKSGGKAGGRKSGGDSAKADSRGQRKRIEAELMSLLPELDEPALAFLLQQAQVIRYNAEVDRINKTAEENQQSSSAASVGKKKELRLERSADGATWHIVCGGSWKMFSAEEMAALVRITRGDSEGLEMEKRLHAWLARERRDVLGDLGIEGPRSQLLAGIARLLRDYFPPRADAT